MDFKTVRNFESISDNLKKRKQKISTIQALDHVPHILELNDLDSFFNDIKPVLRLGQLFGLFPIEGILNDFSRKMTFKIKSVKTLYSIIVIMTNLFMFSAAVMILIENFRENPSEIIHGVSRIVYFGSALFGASCFFLMCPLWIKLQQKWTITEYKLQSFADKNLQLRYKFMTILLIMMGVASIEHVLCYMNFVTDKTISAILFLSYNQCAQAYSLKTVQEFSEISFFQFVVILYLCVANEVSTIIWNFTDIFIVIVATGLAERYKHLNESVINSLSKRGRDAINWQNQCRKKYALLSNLVKETDNTLSPLILLSYFTNLYFICIQLFNGIFVSANGKLAYVYYFMSFILIVGRLFAVSLSAARIHNQSTIILPKIYCCPSRSRVTYRLQFQLTADEITLTGMKFFSITRKFLFTLVGTIVTYELIILQFGKKQ